MLRRRSISCNRSGGATDGDVSDESDDNTGGGGESVVYRDASGEPYRASQSGEITKRAPGTRDVNGIGGVVQGTVGSEEETSLRPPFGDRENVRSRDMRDVYAPFPMSIFSQNLRQSPQRKRQGRKVTVDLLKARDLPMTGTQYRPSAICCISLVHLGKVSNKSVNADVSAHYKIDHNQGVH